MCAALAYCSEDVGRVVSDGKAKSGYDGRCSGYGGNCSAREASGAGVCEVDVPDVCSIYGM